MLSAANNTDCAALVALSITADCGISLVAGGNRHLFVDFVLVNIPTSDDIDQNCAFGKQAPSCNSSMMVTPLVPNPTTIIFSPLLFLEDDDEDGDTFLREEEEDDEEAFARSTPRHLALKLVVFFLAFLLAIVVFAR